MAKKDKGGRSSKTAASRSPKEKRQAKSEPDADDTPPRDSARSGGKRGTDGERSEVGV